MASTYLSKTFGSAGNRRTFTFSAWIRACNISSDSAFFQSGTQGSTEFWTFNIQATGGVYIQGKTGGASDNTWIYTDAVKFFRDPTAWQHWVVAVDTTQSTNTNRIKVYVNGTQFSNWLSPTYPSQNFETAINNASIHTVGARTNGANSFFNGSMTHIHFVDGTAYDASTFGETDATTGIWKPIIEPSVTYGTNGFFLKFNEGALGTDSSPNGNNFTVNGNLTPAKDTPDNVFATLNPLIPNGDSYSNGNNTHTTSSNDYRSAYSTLGVSSGKWYVECKMTNLDGGNGFGIANQESGVGLIKNSANKYIGQDTNDVALFQSGALYNNGSSVATYGTISANDIIGIALDVDNGYVYFSKNGTWQNSGVPTSGLTGTGGYAISNIGSNGTYFFGTSQAQPSISQINFGNGYFGTTPVSSAGSNGNGAIFEYDVPTGFYALNTKNINTYG